MRWWPFKIPGVFYKETRKQWWIKNSAIVLIIGSILFVFAVFFAIYEQHTISSQNGIIISQGQTIIQSQKTNHDLGRSNHKVSSKTLKLEQAYLKEQKSLQKAGSAQLTFAGYLLEVNQVECTFIHVVTPLLSEQLGITLPTLTCPTLSLTGIPGQK